MHESFDLPGLATPELAGDHAHPDHEFTSTSVTDPVRHRNPCALDNKQTGINTLLDSYERLVRVLYLAALFSLSAGPAFAQAETQIGRAATLSPAVPGARYVDGVKVGTEPPPKQSVVRASRCTSGCTLMVTQ